MCKCLQCCWPSLSWMQVMGRVFWTFVYIFILKEKLWKNIIYVFFEFHRQNQDVQQHYQQRSPHYHSPTSSLTSLGSMSLIHSPPPSGMSPSQQQLPSPSHGEFFSGTPRSHQISSQFHHGDFYRMPQTYFGQQQQQQQMPQMDPARPPPLPSPYSQMQGDPFAIVSRAQQMVAVLSEENRSLRQELEGCYDKVARFQKVIYEELNFTIFFFFICVNIVIHWFIVLSSLFCFFLDVLHNVLEAHCGVLLSICFFCFILLYVWNLVIWEGRKQVQCVITQGVYSWPFSSWHSLGTF